MMQSRNTDTNSGLPIVDLDLDTVYSLEAFAEVAGIATQTILLYQEEGLLSPKHITDTPVCFNDEALRTVRRIEHLRGAYEMNLAGIKLTLDLLNEVERLQQDLRLRR